MSSTTTLREAIELLDIDSNPIGSSMIIAGWLRSMDQGEPSTREGECASLNGVMDVYGRIDDPANVRKWIEDIGPALDKPMPDAWVENLVAIWEQDSKEIA